MSYGIKADSSGVEVSTSSLKGTVTATVSKKGSKYIITFKDSTYNLTALQKQKLLQSFEKAYTDKYTGTFDHFLK